MEEEETRICDADGCDETFVVWPRPHRRFCSPQCSQRFHAKRCRGAGVRRTMGVHEQRLCEHCGESFTTKSSRHRYCALACQQADYYRKRCELIRAALEAYEA